MTDSKKTWVIGIADDLEVKNPEREYPETPRYHKPLESRPAAPAASAQSARPVAKAVPRPAAEPPRSRRMQYALLVLLTYLLGPFALLLTTAGRRDRVAVVAGIVAAAGLVAMAMYRAQLLAMAGAGWAAIGIGLLLAALVFVVFSAWARALQVTRAPDQAARVRDGQSLPYWLRKPWVMGLLSLVAPGAGMLLAGRTWRAATVLWSAFIAVLAAVTLMHASWWWGIAHGEASGVVQPGRIEMMLVVAAALLVLSFVGWIAQALEGVRQGLLASGRSGTGRGDRMAVALGVALLALFVAASPARLAGELDYRADLLHGEGYRIIPLGLTLTAQRLDPGRPAYAVQASRLYAELGMTDRAVRTMDHLRAEVEPVLAALELPEAGVRTRETPARDPEAELRMIFAVDEGASPPVAGADPAQPKPVVDPDLGRSLQGVMMGSMSPIDPK